MALIDVGPAGVPPRPVPDALKRRFRILRHLGSGAEGSVYLALDRAPHGGRISLKILDRPPLRAQPQLRLRLSALARIDHPNIARILDFEIDRDLDRAWVAREYVPGDDLGRFAAKEAGAVARVLPPLLESAARALLQFHDRDLAHGDIRPANMLCSRTRGVPMLKLIDGGTTLLPAEPSPSQLTHHRRQDLRFVGAAFYTALTGKPPLRGVDPRALNPSIPAWINRLILRLLVPYSPDGVGSAERFLEEILRASRTMPRGRHPELALSKPPLVGRASELARAQAGVDAAQAGRTRPGVIVISGERGSGKTALLREAQVYSRARGVPFLTARAPAGNGLPYEPLLQVTQSVATLHGWRDPFESLRARTPAELVDAGVRLLRRAARRGPLVIAIDDAQTIVPLAGEVLRGIAQAVNERLLFLVAVRGEEEARRWTEGLGPAPCETIPLGGLPPDAAATLLRLAIGMPPDERFVERLLALTAGNPGLLLASLGILRPRLRRDGAAVTVSSLGALPIPEDSEKAARALVARLDPSLLPTAQRLSVHPGFLKESICREALRDADADRALRALAAEGLLRRVSLHSYEWTSTAVRLALHGSLGRIRREEAHRSFARAGRRWMRPGTLASNLFQAYHLARTGRPRRAQAPALASARLLSSVHRYGEARDYYELALRLLPSGDAARTTATLTALQAVCRKGGFHSLGKRASLELLRRRPSLAQAAVAAHFVRMVDGPRAAVSFLDGALRSRGRRSPGALALLHAKRASALSLAGRPHAALRAAERAELYLSECRNPAIAADVYLDIGSLQYVRGRLPLATEYYLAALRLTRKAKDPAREAALYDNLSLALRGQLRLAGAMRYARRGLAIKLRCGLLLESAVTRMVLGALLDDAGDHEAGKAELLQAREVFRSRGDTVRQAWATVGIGSIHLALEEHAEAVEWFNRTLDLAPRNSRNDLALAAHAGKLQVFLSTGDLAQAEACLRSGAAELHEGAGFEARLAWIRARTLFEVARGRPKEARRLLGEAEKELVRSEARTYRYQFRLLGFLLDVAGGATEIVAGRLEELIGALEESGLRGLLCEALVLGAEAQVQVGRARRARALLGRLEALFPKQPQPSFRIRAGLVRARLEAPGGARLRACLEAFRLATKHELGPLRRSAALALARLYEERADYPSALRYYQEARDDAGNRSA